MDAAAPSPEAYQRPSYEADPEVKAPDLGKWAGIIAAARDRLTALAVRLDAAFGRIRDQVLKSVPDVSYVTSRAPMLDVGGGGEMTRAPDSGPVNARAAVDLRPEPSPAPSVNEDRAREIQRAIEAGRKTETYDRDRMRDLAREHHELRGAAPDIAPVPKEAKPSENREERIQRLTDELVKSWQDHGQRPRGPSR